MRLSRSPFGSGLAIGPRNLPSSSSRLRRGYDKAPRGAIKVDLVDGDQLAAEGKGNAAALGHHLAGLEGRRLFLSNADKHHAVVDLGVRPILGCECVFALTMFEMDQRHLVLDGECLHGLDEAVMQRSEECR